MAEIRYWFYFWTFPFVIKRTSLDDHNWRNDFDDKTFSTMPADRSHSATDVNPDTKSRDVRTTLGYLRLHWSRIFSTQLLKTNPRTITPFFPSAHPRPRFLPFHLTWQIIWTIRVTVEKKKSLKKNNNNWGANVRRSFFFLFTARCHPHRQRRRQRALKCPRV